MRLNTWVLRSFERVINLVEWLRFLRRFFWGDCRDWEFCRDFFEEIVEIFEEVVEDILRSLRKFLRRFWEVWGNFLRRFWEVCEIEKTLRLNWLTQRVVESSWAWVFWVIEIILFYFYFWDLGKESFIYILKKKGFRFGEWMFWDFEEKKLSNWDIEEKLRIDRFFETKIEDNLK